MPTVRGARSRGHPRTRRSPSRGSVEVEAHLQPGIPGFAIVGLADRACQEAKHRVRSGVVSAGAGVAAQPAHHGQSRARRASQGGLGFDLPISLAVLGATRQLPPERLADHAAVGELALDGRIRPVSGTLAVAEGARRAGLKRVVCAAESAPGGGARRHRAGARPGILARSSRTSAARSTCPRSSRCPDRTPTSRWHPIWRTCAGRSARAAPSRSPPPDRHNLLPLGPPGNGKTMLARRLAGDPAAARRAREALEVTRIHSVAGISACRAARWSRIPPFRAPHHGVVGAGDRRRRAESAAGRGDARAPRRARSLDELPGVPALGARSRCGSRSRTASSRVARVGGHALFPARFQLVGTMNMCPCGARGDPGASSARARRSALAAYREKLSRALLDRFDLAVAMPRPRAAELAAPARRAVERRCAARVARSARARSAAVRTHRAARRSCSSSAVDRLPLSGRGRAARRPASRGRSPRSRGPTPWSRRTSREALSYRHAAESFRPRDASPLYSPPRRRLPRAARARSTIRRRGSIVRGAAAIDVARSARRRDRRRARVLRVRALGRALAGARARGRRARRRQRPGARDRRRGASRRARGGGRDRRRPRLRDRPRLPGRARRARATDRASGPRRLGVRARRRAGAVALPGPQPDHRRPLSPRPSSSRHASEAARSSRPTSRSRKVATSSPSRARSRARSRPARTRCSGSARRR